MTKRQIIAMGGGGFSMEPDNPLLDQYILQQTATQKPKICFIPTGSGDSDSYIQRFYKCFRELDCEPSHLSLFEPPSLDLESFVLEKDILFVGGGNTRSLLALWREWGLDSILRQAWEQGIVLSGLSAGAICWFEAGVTDSLGSGTLTPLTNALGLLSGSMCPHYDGNAMRRPVTHQLLLRGDIPGGYAADDGAALHFIGTDLYQVVSSRRDVRAYQVAEKEGEVLEQTLPVHYLGTDDDITK